MLRMCWHCKGINTVGLYGPWVKHLHWLDNMLLAARFFFRAGTKYRFTHLLAVEELSKDNRWQLYRKKNKKIDLLCNAVNPFTVMEINKRVTAIL